MKNYLPTIMKIYIETAIDYGELMDKGDFETAASCFDRNEAAVKMLLKYGYAGSEALLELLKDENAYVRLTSATNLLGTYEDTAHDVLQELKKQPGFIGFNANMILTDWEKNDLVAPRFEEVSLPSEAHALSVA